MSCSECSYFTTLSSKDSKPILIFPLLMNGTVASGRLARSGSLCPIQGPTMPMRPGSKELATFLRANGIEARFDVWYLRPGMDTPQWMSNELDLADRVLLVCDELYAQKADRRHGGVGWEIRIIQGDLLVSQEDNPDKYIPIIVTPELNAGTPKFLRGTFALHWPESGPDEVGRRDELLRIIYNRQEEAPPLGRPRALFWLPQISRSHPDWRPVMSAY